MSCVAGRRERPRGVIGRLRGVVEHQRGVVERPRGVVEHLRGVVKNLCRSVRECLWGALRRCFRASLVDLKPVYT